MQTTQIYRPVEVPTMRQLLSQMFRDELGKQDAERLENETPYERNARIEIEASRQAKRTNRAALRTVLADKYDHELTRRWISSREVA